MKNHRISLNFETSYKIGRVDAVANAQYCWHRGRIPASRDRKLTSGPSRLISHLMKKKKALTASSMRRELEASFSQQHLRMIRHDV